VDTIEAMRFSVVLFDLDGTVIDSGAIILASMRHAAKEVLGLEPPDEELMAAVGGPGLEAQMRALAPDRVDELVTVYRAHNEPLHDTLVCCAGMDDVLVRLKDEGRRLGIVTAKRRATVELAFATVPLGHLFETVVGGDETTRHKPDPDPLLLALERLGARPDDTAYVGDAPFDVRAAKAAGVHAVAVTWGGIHPRERLEREEPDAIVNTAEELLGVL
jgi:pyrophosphatase PpaX